MDHQAGESSFYHSRESKVSAPYDEEIEIETTIQVSLDDQHRLEEMARYRERFGPSFYESESDSTIVRREFEFRRIIFVRKPVSRGRMGISSMLEAFDSRSGRNIPAGAIIYDLDSHTFSSNDLKQ